MASTKPKNEKAAGVASADGNQKNIIHHYDNTAIGGGNPSGLRAEEPGLLTLQFTFPGNPVPAMRPRLGRHRTYNPPVYTRYKTALVQALKKAFGHLALDIPPTGTKQRGHYLASHRYRLVVEVYRVARKGDADNYLKTVQDAIQQAGIIGDDSQVDEVYCRKHIDRENPRVAFVLEELAQKGGVGRGA